MPLTVNCDCEDEAGDARTLAALRSELIGVLGFIDPIDSIPTRTLGDMKTEILTRLGLADPLAAAETRSLVDLRKEMLRLSGYGAQTATPPPGMEDTLTDVLNEAQATAFRRLELDKGGVAYPARMIADSDQTTIDYNLVLNLAMGTYKAHIGRQDAEGYFQRFEQQLKDEFQRRPPNIEQIVADYLRDAQETVYRRYELGNTGSYALGAFADDAHTTTVDPQPVMLLAIANVKSKVGQSDASNYSDQFERYMDGLLARSPPNMTTYITGLLTRTQAELYRRHRSIHTQRWFTWTMAGGGTRFFGVDENDEIGGCTKALAADGQREVWIEDTSGAWLPMSQGISPALYTNDAPGVPYYYEIRQCIEVWPPPDGAHKLRIKGHFGLLPFTADAHKTTVNADLLFTRCAALAKRFYKQPDADDYNQAASDILQSLVAGDHGTRRYVPHAVTPAPSSRPRFIPLDP